MKDDIDSFMITKDTAMEYIVKLSGKCEICGHCCKFDSGIFLDEDIKKLAKSMSVPEEEFKARYLEEKEIFNKKVWKAKLKRDGKPFGPCLFLDDKECSIHEMKPKHCKIASGCNEYGRQINMWFMLNHVLDADDPEAIRQWAQYLKTHPSIPGGELHELVKDKEKLAKIMDYTILK